MRWMIFALWFVSVAAHAQELSLQPVPVAPNVYAVVGDLAGQSYENDGLNNNLGFVVSDAGVLVINTGPSARVARALHAAIRKITAQPVKWVVNVNSQNHYWHGNGYFKSQGAAILASKEAERVMREMGAQQLEANKALLKEKADSTVLTYPTELITDWRELKLGKTAVQLLHFGPAHTPGDLVVWLPQQKILFAGDIVYTERLLAVARALLAKVVQADLQAAERPGMAIVGDRSLALLLDASLGSIAPRAPRELAAGHRGRQRGAAQPSR